MKGLRFLITSSPNYHMYSLPNVYVLIIAIQYKSSYFHIEMVTYQSNIYGTTDAKDLIGFIRPTVFMHIHALV